jgi:uncharacterized protein YgiM (DUF1202 family)
LAVALSTSLALAQDSTPAPSSAPPVVPAGEPPATPARAESPKAKEAAKSKRKPAAKPAATDAPKSSPLTQPEPAVVVGKNTNVRGQADIHSEVVLRLKQGEIVTVLEEITKKPKPDEPGQWSMIALPASSHVWVSTHFIDANTKVVLPKRLNLRSGPGENYSVLGRLDQGAVVKELETKGTWMKIEAPINAHAFVASHLISRDKALVEKALALSAPKPPVVAAVTPPPQPPLETVVVPVTPPPDTTPAPATPPPPPVIPPAVTETAPPAPAAPAEEIFVKRVVTREGIVKRSLSIQAPTYFVLTSRENNRTLNYLHSPAGTIAIKDYFNQRVLITGEEVLDERWPNTPVIEVETIQAVP